MALGTSSLVSTIIGLITKNGGLLNFKMIRILEHILVHQHGGLILRQIVLHGDVGRGHHAIQGKRICLRKVLVKSVSGSAF